MVDNESSVNILYLKAYLKMNLAMYELKSMPSPLYGFKGDGIKPLGIIQLMMIMGEHPHQTHAMTDFLMVNRLTMYNVVIGCPTLKKLKAITLIYYLMMKFPTPYTTSFAQLS